MSGGDRLGGVAAVLTLDVRDRLAQELRAHARHGVLPTPSEPEHVAGLPARGIAAPTLEQLDEPREVKPGAGADQEMRMGLQEAETHDRRPLLESDLSKVLVEKRDRKSTRLNSSHTVISYAVFCLKKKKKTKNR